MPDTLNTFSINKCFPIPTRVGSMYPFAAMEVGDSFDVPVPEGADASRVEKRVRSSAVPWKHSETTKRRFTIRIIRAAPGCVIRCWRIS